MINTELFKEVSPLSSKDCFILIERQKTNFNFPIHIHPECELNFIENAKGAQRIVGDSIEEIDEEELVLVTNPHLEHAWKDYRNVSKNIHEITIQFHPDLLTDTFLNKNQMISIILHELSIDKGMRELSTGQFAANVMHQHSSDESLGRVMDYLSRHYSEVIRLSEVAEMVNMSESSFCRFFKQHTSKSFIDFLTDIRLGAASRALIDSSLSIAEIGYDCGFNNLSNFNRIFKKKKGVTPSEFRDNYRKNKTII